eukprot:TRINITY_DN82624_c0_g1_i1.p1 TRINITY_DN82624_c0_g1~~TRINITY_DN82624_c0_g1_i1.p1  ORF type:complete len:166 (-),score=22.49 TRINITY_DN82624_c0_g1_i1:109-606(-)
MFRHALAVFTLLVCAAGLPDRTSHAQHRSGPRYRVMTDLDDDMEDLPIEAGLPPDSWSPQADQDRQGFLQVDSAAAKTNARYLADSQAALNAAERGASLNSNEEYVAESASGLSRSLGKRWNGPQLEKDADQKVKTFLEAIQSVKAQSSALDGIGKIASDIAFWR